MLRASAVAFASMASLHIKYTARAFDDDVFCTSFFPSDVEYVVTALWASSFDAKTSPRFNVGAALLVVAAGHLAFPDGFKVLVELDGPQHFWKSARYYSAEGCQRDLEKEIWAKQQGLCVVRVLQENVWNDLHGWKGWIIRSFQDARSGEPRPLTPDDREYRSKESAYVRARD